MGRGKPRSSEFKPAYCFLDTAAWHLSYSRLSFPPLDFKLLDVTQYEAGFSSFCFNS